MHLGPSAEARPVLLYMAEEASSSYSGPATEVPSLPLNLTFQAGQLGCHSQSMAAGRASSEASLSMFIPAGQPGLPQPKHSGRQAKPYKHASPFRKAPEDRPFATGNMPSTNGAHVNEVPAFPAFPQSPGTALNGMHTGVGSSRGDAPSANGTYMSGGLRTFPRSPGPALNGIHAGIGSSTGAADSAASAAAAAAQLPPKFASAMNISEGPATTPAQRRVPHSAAKLGHKSAARRRGHLSTSGGSLGTPGGGSTFLREGSPMDWSPSVPTSAAPAPAGILGEAQRKDNDLDDLDADLAASSISGKGNKQHTQLNEAFSSRFSLGSHQHRKAGQPAAESANAPEASNTANPGSAAAQEVPARGAAFGSQAEQSSQATNRTGAEREGHSVAEGIAFPEAPSAGQKGQPQSAADQTAAYVPRTGSLAGGSLGARSMSEDSSADSGLPRGVLHHRSSRSPIKGHHARTSHLSQAAKQMKESRQRMKVNVRPRMTLKDFSAAAKAQANSSITANVPDAHSGSMPAGSRASKGASGFSQAANGQTNGYVHASDKPKPAVTDQGQAWRSYVCGRTQSPQETSPTQPRPSSGSASERQRPATADLDEYLSRQHQSASEDPEAYASAAASIPLQRDTPSSTENVDHKASFIAKQASRREPTEASESHNAVQDEPTGCNVRPDVMETHVFERQATEANSNGNTFSFGQQGKPESTPYGEQPCGDMAQGQRLFLSAAAAFKFAAPAADRNKAQPKVQHSSKRTAAQAGRPVHQQGSPQSFNSNPAGPAGASRQPFVPFGGPQAFVFGSGSPAEGQQQPGMPQEPSSSSAWLNADFKQSEPTPTASASQNATPKPFAAEQASPELPETNFAATYKAQVPWAASNSQPLPFPCSFPGTFGSGQGASWAGTTPEKPAWESAASPDFRTPGSFPSFAARTEPVETPKQDSGFVFGGQRAHPGTNQKPAQEGPALPELHTPGPFPGFAAQAQPNKTPQQGQVPSQQEPGFVFFEQQAHPTPQEDSAGSARARGFPMGSNLGSQNRTPLQRKYHKAHVRTPSAKAAKPQAPAASTQEVPAYAQPRPRMPIPVRSSHPFDPPREGAPTRGASPTEAAHSAHEADVEKLRQRGNDAFQRGTYTRAADLYNRAIKQQRQLGTAEGLGKLYSNLAACFLQQEQFVKATQACALALQAEPGFYKANIRMATCHMRLGDVAAARATLDATPDLQEYADVAAKLAEINAHGTRIDAAVSAAESADTTSAAEAALVSIEAMLKPDQAPGSQNLKRLRDQLMLQLSRFEDVAGVFQPERSAARGLPIPDWQWWLAVQASFHRGELQGAVGILANKVQPEYNAAGATYGIAIGIWKGSADQSGQQLEIEHAKELLKSMQSMLDLKEDGNRALKNSQGQQAVDHYSKALELEPPPSIPFAAVLYANRAAAEQSLGQHAKAIADCLRATALKPDYAKAHSRLAALLADVKHSNSAVDILEKLQGLVKESQGEAADVARRLGDARSAAKSGAIDHYKLLGVEHSVSSEDVRKAYKKSALQLHPDKALKQCRFTVRLGIQGLELSSRSETEGRIRDSADWLFKCIAEAYTVLTNPDTRQQLDLDLARQDRRSSASMPQRARTGSYRSAPMHRDASGCTPGQMQQQHQYPTYRRPPSPYTNYGSRPYGYGHGSSRDYSFDDEDHETYSSNRWSYF